MWGDLILTLGHYRCYQGNPTKGALLLGNITLDNHTMDNITLGYYTLVKLTLTAAQVPFLSRAASFKL